MSLHIRFVLQDRAVRWALAGALAGNAVLTPASPRVPDYKSGTILPDKKEERLNPLSVSTVRGSRKGSKGRWQNQTGYTKSSFGGQLQLSRPCLRQKAGLVS